MNSYPKCSSAISDNKGDIFPFSITDIGLPRTDNVEVFFHLSSRVRNVLKSHETLGRGHLQTH